MSGSLFSVLNVDPTRTTLGMDSFLHPTGSEPPPSCLPPHTRSLEEGPVHNDNDTGRLGKRNRLGSLTGSDDARKRRKILAGSKSVTRRRWRTGKAIRKELQSRISTSWEVLRTAHQQATSDVLTSCFPEHQDKDRLVDGLRRFFESKGCIIKKRIDLPSDAAVVKKKKKKAKTGIRKAFDDYGQELVNELGKFCDAIEIRS